MLRNEIIDKLKEVFELVIGEDRVEKEITEDTYLVEDLGLNSVGILYLVIGVEETFDVRFENVGISDFKTVRQVVDYIYGQLNA